MHFFYFSSEGISLCIFTWICTGVGESFDLLPIALHPITLFLKTLPTYHSLPKMWNCKLVRAYEFSCSFPPCVKFRKYFEMRQCQKIRFKVLTWKSMRKFFKVFLSGQGKLLILQHIWLYIIISISKEIRPMLRLSHISVYIKS